MYRLIFSSLLLLYLIMPMQHSLAASGDNTSTGLGPTTRSTFTFADLGYSVDQTFRGVLVTHAYNIRWPDAWTVQPGNTLNLHFSHSHVLNESSSLAVDWNGTRLSSILLLPDNADHSVLQVDIPENLIQLENNQLRIVLYMGIHDDFCIDLDNPAVWTTIHSSSYLEFSYYLNKPILDLGLFPKPLIDGSTLVKNHITFVLPSKPTLIELNVLAALSSKLGQLAAWRLIEVDVKYGPSVAELQEIEGDQIYIGMLDNLGKYGFINFNPIPKDNQKSGVGLLLEQYLPWDETSVAIVISGLDEYSVQIAGQALADESTYTLLSGQSGIILDPPLSDAEAGVPGMVITLMELGYTDITTHGIHDQTININIPLPMAWIVETEGTFTLHFAHSELLYAQQSSVNILLNDTPVSSIALTQENAKDESVLIRLPARLFKVGDNKLSILTNMNLLKDYEDRLRCWYDYYDEAWFVVYADSQLNLPPGPAEITVDLSDYPYNFIGLSDMSDTAFVLPDNPSEAVGKALAWVGGRIGHYVDGKALYPIVVDAKTSLGLGNKVPYQILIGEPTDNVAIQTLNDTLPLPYKVGSNEPENLERYADILPRYDSVGYIQTVITSEKQPRLIVTGNNDEGITWAAEALSDPQLIGALDGDLVILNVQDRLFTASVHVETPRQITAPVTDEGVNSSASPTMWIFSLSGILLFVTVCILLTIVVVDAINRRKVRGRYEAHFS